MYQTHAAPVNFIAVGLGHVKVSVPYTVIAMKCSSDQVLFSIMNETKLLKFM